MCSTCSDQVTRFPAHILTHNKAIQGNSPLPSKKGKKVTRPVHESNG